MIKPSHTVETNTRPINKSIAERVRTAFIFDTGFITIFSFDDVRIVFVTRETDNVAAVV